MSNRLKLTTGEKIRLLRKRRNYTQFELAELAHTTQATISRAEQDNHLPHAATLLRIAAVLDIEASYLVDIDSTTTTT